MIPKSSKLFSSIFAFFIEVNLPGAKEVEAAGGRIWAGKEDAEEIKKQCHLDEVVPMRDGDAAWFCLAIRLVDELGYLMLIFQFILGIDPSDDFLLIEATCGVADSVTR